jgi:serine/threonine protein kinase
MPKWKHHSILKEVEEFGTHRWVRFLVDKTTQEKIIQKQVHQPPQATQNLLDKLIREYYFLENLADAGITPIPKSLSLSPDMESGELLMNFVSGEAIVSHSEPPTPVQKLLFDNLILEVTKAIQIIHDRGIIIGDLNQETFLIEGFWDNNSELRIKLIDLGFAARPAEINVTDIEDWLKLFYKINPKFNKLIQKSGFVLDIKIAKKMEFYRAMRVILGYFLQEPWDNPLGFKFEQMNRSKTRSNLDNALKAKNVYAGERVLDFLAAVFSRDINKMPTNSYMLQTEQNRVLLSFTDVLIDPQRSI